MSASLPYALAGLWAGVVLGGSLVAAPAKFEAQSLTLEVALDVGRAQFFWIGVTEVLICAALLVSLAFAAGRRWRWALAAAALLAFQRLILMPPLDARTLQIIAGEPVSENSLHTVFIVGEVVKFLLLAAMAYGILKMTKDCT